MSANLNDTSTLLKVPEIQQEFLAICRDMEMVKNLRQEAINNTDYKKKEEAVTAINELVYRLVEIPDFLQEQSYLDRLSGQLCKTEALCFNSLAKAVWFKNPNREKQGLKRWQTDHSWTQEWFLKTAKYGGSVEKEGAD